LTLGRERIGEGWRCRVFPEEKFGPLELEGEVNPPEEEDVSDAPTIIMPEMQFHRKEETRSEPDILWPFF
jgi:hypothetical protein